MAVRLALLQQSTSHHPGTSAAITNCKSVSTPPHKQCKLEFTHVSYPPFRVQSLERGRQNCAGARDVVSGRICASVPFPRKNQYTLCNHQHKQFARTHSILLCRKQCIVEESFQRHVSANPTWKTHMLSSASSTNIAKPRKYII